jgi:Lrp/AsnC family leucine-responsive transcriptional regulator
MNEIKFKIISHKMTKNLNKMSDQGKTLVMILKKSSNEFKLDSLDIKILETLLDEGRIKFKDLAKVLRIDERMVSRRVDRLVKGGIIRKFTLEIDWSKLGFGMQAYVCTRTAVGEVLRKQLFEFFNSHPRIVRADSTVGAYEYILYSIFRDLQDFRSRIGTPLEPLTAGISTSIISHPIKQLDYKPLLKVAAEIANIHESTSRVKEKG